jgi:hypothetical protein
MEDEILKTTINHKMMRLKYPRWVDAIFEGFILELKSVFK